MNSSSEIFNRADHNRKMLLFFKWLFAQCNIANIFKVKHAYSRHAQNELMLTAKPFSFHVTLKCIVK